MIAICFRFVLQTLLLNVNNLSMSAKESYLPAPRKNNTDVRFSHKVCVLFFVHFYEKYRQYLTIIKCDSFYSLCKKQCKILFLFTQKPSINSANRFAYFRGQVFRLNQQFDSIVNFVVNFKILIIF